MGLDSNVQKIIKSIAECNIGDARKWSVLALEGDKTQKNKWFVNKYKAILTSEGANMIELPGKGEKYLQIEKAAAAKYLSEEQFHSLIDIITVLDKKGIS